MMPSEKNTKRVILALDQAYEKFTQLEDESTDEAEIVAYRCYYTNIYESKLYVEQMQKEIDRLKAEQPKWIPVDERLSDNYEKVLIYDKKWGVLPGWHSKNYWNTSEVKNVTEITHWMPNPTPPKAGEQE